MSDSESTLDTSSSISSSQLSSCSNSLTEEDENSDIDKFLKSCITTFEMVSPHNPSSFTSLSFAREFSTYELFKICESEDAFLDSLRLSTLPWHVVGSCNFLIDVQTLGSKNDVGVDAFRWDNNKTLIYSIHDHDNEERVIKGDDENCTRFVKRYYKCRSSNQISRIIVAVYPPHVSCKGRNKHPYENCNSVLIMYSSASRGVISPSKNVKTYASIKEKVKRKLTGGMKPARATYEVEREEGGIQNIKNQSFLPHRSQAYSAKKKIALQKKEEDPLKELLLKQRADGATGHSYIRRITLDDTSLSIVLFSDRVVSNIANYCTTEDPMFKSALSFDFTFELMKSPPLYALVGTYTNTSPLSKRTNIHPVMLGPMLLTPSREEKTVKLLFDALLECCPGLGPYVQVLGVDGEKALSNAGCDTFFSALLLLCSNHSKTNITSNLKDLLNEENLRKEIYVDIFGNDFMVGLIDSETTREYDTTCRQLLEKWEKHAALTAFIDYFKKWKYNEFKYHLIKGVVECANLASGYPLYTNNAAECMNNVTKSWNAYDKEDIYNFCISYEKLLERQESDTVRACLGLESQYYVRLEFAHMWDNLTFPIYAVKTVEEKAKLHSEMTNILVDKEKYRDVKAFSTGSSAVKRARLSIENSFLQNEPFSNDVENDNLLTSMIHTPKNNDTMHKLQTPSVNENAVASTVTMETVRKTMSSVSLLREDILNQCIRKALEIVQRRELAASYKPNVYLVRSYSQLADHEVHLRWSCIVCDCKNHRASSTCAHAIAVAIEKGCLEKYCESLSSKKGTFTAIASVNIRKDSGKKGPNRVFKRAASPMQLDLLPGVSNQIFDVNNKENVDFSASQVDLVRPFVQGGLLPLEENQYFGSRPTTLPVMPNPWYRVPNTSVVIGSTAKGQKMSAKPSPPRSFTPYDIIIRHSRIKSCAGCDKPRVGTLLLEKYVIVRKEQDFYPHQNDDGSRSWHLSRRETNKHYHINLSCLRKRNANFNISMISMPAKVTITNEISSKLREIGFTDIPHPSSQGNFIDL